MFKNLSVAAVAMSLAIVQTASAQVAVKNQPVTLADVRKTSNGFEVSMANGSVPWSLSGYLRATLDGVAVDPSTLKRGIKCVISGKANKYDPSTKRPPAPGNLSALDCKSK